MDYKNLTAPCGLACFACELYLANENAEIRKILAANFNIPEEKAVCQGCRAEKGIVKVLGKTKPCSVYTCVNKKNIHTCAECTTDFPCDKLRPAADQADKVPHNLKAYNICLIKKMGLKKWAEEEAVRVKNDYFNKKLIVCE